MNKKKSIQLTPSPHNLLESLRDIGYSMETAIADLIDNSVAARSTNIQIRFMWNSGMPWLAVIDDGEGMSQAELVEAMRLGSMNPNQMRETTDLGRFGLGMKTASISQCRHLVVASKKNNTISLAEWDLDSLDDEWLLGIPSMSSLGQDSVLHQLLEKHLSSQASGTIVFWGKMDRCDKGSTANDNTSFDMSLDRCREHIQEVFHRFISPRRGERRIRIDFNNAMLAGVDPFNRKHLATQELSEQSFEIDGQTIRVQPYVLPHQNKASTTEYETYAGEQGYLHNQGFYIYRNRRLIIKGSWFRLIKKNELNKLIRVQVDIPNTLDHLWGIDVMKSHASPPRVIREKLKQIIDKIADTGKRVYVQRGKVLRNRIAHPVWDRRATKGGVSYEISRAHPLLKEQMERLHKQDRVQLEHLLQMIETSFPGELFYSDYAGSPTTVASEPDDANTAYWIEQAVQLLPKGSSPDDIRQYLLGMEPFSQHPLAIDKYLDSRGNHE